MKTEVYYFTGTGNSLAVARDIAQKTEGRLISISEVLNNETIEIGAKTAIIVFPVYMWGIPLIVERFVKSIKNLQDISIYAIATYGGMPAATINVFAETLEKCGGKLAAGFAVKMPGNYTPMYGAISEKSQKKMFANWTKKADFVADYINSGKPGRYENNNWLISSLFTGVIYNSSAKYIPQMDCDFLADEKCNKCGICQKICPVSNIHIENGTPVWEGKCEQCMACLQWCPEKAIQYSKATAKRKRYHHPKVTLTDILNRER